MCSPPPVSVVILNHKRRDALMGAVDSAVRQDYGNREIIVVDNGSQDGTGEFIAAYAPEIKVIELPENLGAGGGRNAGIREARGQIVVTVDNDVYFDSPLELSKVVRTFERRPDVHVLAFQLCDAQSGELRVREWCHPRSWKDFGQSEFETNYFVEGAAAFRREVFEVCGPYYEPLFIYNEGLDLALRLIDRGFKILYCPEIRTRHLMSPAARNRERAHYLFTRNYVWIAYKDYYLWSGVRFLIPKLLMMAYFTWREHCYSAFVRGLWDGLAGLRLIRRDRTPISKAAVNYNGELEKWRPNWRVRFARHRSGVQL